MKTTTETGKTPPSFDTVKDRALRLLARRDHSVRELRSKLRFKLKIDDATFDKLVSYLKEMGYLADEGDLARRWVRQWRGEGRGRRWIEGKLRMKGLKGVNLKDDDEEMEAARKFLEKKIGSQRPEKLAMKEKAKVARSMISRGFSTSIVATLMK